MFVLNVFQMVRSRKRTTERSKWDEETLKRAFELVASGRSVKSVAAETGIPRITLHDRLKSKCTAKPALGRKSYFTPEQESILADHIKQLSNQFYGITLTDLRRLAYDLAEELNIKHNFNKETKMAGEDWVAGFRKRNPTLSLRQPSATSLNRVLAFNKSEVDLFFTNLEEVYKKHPFKADRIFNMDETGISTVQKPGKVLAPKGQHQVGSVTSWERGRNITVVCTLSAAGGYIPPMFIYPRKRMSPQLEKGGPAGAIYKCSHNGWSNEELFLDWLKHFKDNAKPTEEDPVLLIMDNHGSHISLDSYEVCRANHIHVVSIPPHTSHRLQPLDLSFYGPLKKAFNIQCDRFLRANRFQKISVYDIASIFNEAYMKVATMEKGVSGFSAAGIIPFKPENFSGLDFISETEIQTPIIIDPENVDDPITDKTLDEGCDAVPQEPGNLNSMCVETSHLSGNEPPEIVKNPEIKKKTCLNLTGLYANPEAGTSKANSDAKSRTEFTQEPSHFKEALESLSPLQPLHNSDKQIPKGNRKQHSIIMTATPMKAVLEEAKKKKEIKDMKAKHRLEKLLEDPKIVPKQKLKILKSKKRKPTKVEKKSHIKLSKAKCSATVKGENKIKKRCRRQISFEESSSEEEFDESKLCDDNESDDNIDLFSKDTEMCLVCGEFGTKTELWFRCVFCGKWAHADCSGFDSAENYTCDFCSKN